MAYIGTCPNCKDSKSIDTHCGYCYECLDKYPNLGGHKPTCRVAIKKAKERAIQLLRLHKLLELNKKISQDAEAAVEALLFALRTIDPCPECNGRDSRETHSLCKTCGTLGFNKDIDKLRKIAKAPAPPPTY